MKAMPIEIPCCRRRTRQRRPWFWGLIAAAVYGVSSLLEANPLLPGADPHAVVLGDTVWVYPTWSDDRRGQRFFAFSSTNWTDWRRHGPVLDLAEVKWIKDDGADQHRAWAPGVLEYLSNGLIQPIRMTSGPGNAGLQAGAPRSEPALAHRAEQGPAHEQRYPSSPAVVDVTQPPYAARGDGVTDDTEALQRAFNENVGQARVLYFPAGTYLVSRTLTWPKRWEGRENWGFTTLRGQHRDRSVIRLKERIFADTTQPQAILWCGGFGSADWFHNYVENLTFDVGQGNPAAVALQFYSNNSGAVRDCRFVAPPGSGWVGLDLAHRDMNGPVFVTRCEVTGFRRGVVTGHSVNSQTFEHLALRGQSEFGFDNTGQAIAIRGLVSDNAVPAVRSYGTLALIEAKLTGRNGAARLPAIVNYNGGRLLLRDIATRGYGRALGDVATPDYLAAFRLTGEDRPGSAGPDIAEYFSQAPTRLFPGPGRSLRLPIRETPLTPWDEPATWANGVDFGADPTGQADASAAIQKAVDSGATTVFLPAHFNLRTPVILRGKVRRLLGTGGSVNYGKGLGPDFRLEDGDAPVVFIEHFGNIHGGLQVDTRRTLVLRSVQDCDLTFTDRAAGGDRFFEDFVTHRLRLIGQSVWARQLNVENEGTHLVNDAGDLWILGYKTERGGTLLETRNAGRSEVLGNFSYTTTAGKLAPMLVIQDAALFAFFHEVCYNGDPFETWVQETRGTQTKFLRRGEGSLLPFAGFAP